MGISKNLQQFMVKQSGILDDNRQRKEKNDAQKRLFQWETQQRAQEEQNLPPIRVEDPAPMTGANSGFAGTNLHGIRRLNTYIKAPSTTEEGFTRVQPLRPVEGYRSIGDPHFEDAGFDAGRDPGGNRIFQDPQTGLEHYYPKGRRAPVFHHEERKRITRNRNEADIAEAGRFRMSDIWKNLW